MITMHEVLSLDSFKNFKLVAGIGGLDRSVCRSGFIDHEIVEDIKAFVIPNELIFSNLVQIKDEPELLYDMVEALIHQDAAGFAIKTVFFKEIPDDVMELANNHRFPIFLFSETYIETLILEIDGVLNKQKALNKKIAIIDEILSSQKDHYGIRALAKKLNRQFMKKMTVFYIKGNSNINLLSIEKILGDATTLLPYREGYLLMVSYSEGRLMNHDSVLQNTGLKHFGTIGVSQEMDHLGLLNEGIEQAMIAEQFCRFRNMSVCKYKDLGIFKVLIPILDSKMSFSYFEEIIGSLKAYDLKHQTDLLDTACVYIENDGNIKLTAEKLFQHQNTLRYRIKKIYEVLDLNQLNGMRYETLAIAIHLYKLNQL